MIQETMRPEGRVLELLAKFSSSNCCLARILCDDHDPSSVAYHVVGLNDSVSNLTYGELRANSEKLAAGFASLGIRAGDRVATLMGKSAEYLTTLMAIWRLGAVHVPLFTAFAPPAIAFRLIGSGAKMVVCDDKQVPKLAAGDDIPANPPWQVVVPSPSAPEHIAFDALMNTGISPPSPAIRSGDAPMIHIYTSGTTGTPKGVVIPIKALASFQAYAEFALDIRSDDVFWCAADPGWAYGLYYGVLVSFLTGVPSVLLEGGFSPETTLKTLADLGVTNFAAAPTVYRALRSSHAAVPAALKIRCASSAGEPLTPDVNEWAERSLGVTVHDHYGQTEMGMMINNHHHPLLKQPIKPGSMGRAMPGFKAVVLDEKDDKAVGPGVVGRVALELADSPLATFRGYYNEPAKTAEKFAGSGRWYITGDTGSVDSDGYFHFSSRDDDVIIMAGYRIGPFEVESVIVRHPAVAECAVIAVPDDVRGEVMEAFVVLQEGHSGSDTLGKDIQNWVKTRYAAHAFPRTVHFAESLPKTPSGKIQRFMLKKQRLLDLKINSSA